MSKQDVTIALPKTSTPGHPVLRRNAKGTVPNFWLWYEWVGEAAQLYFPASFKELSTAPPVETEVETMMRLAMGIPRIPLDNESDDLLTDAQYAELADIPNLQARALAQSREVNIL